MPGYYPYNPSLPLAAVFLGLYSATTVVHTFQLFRKRSWFMIPFLVGLLFQVIGYIGRCVSIEQKPDYTLGPFAVQLVLILIAPALYAATIYMTLGRIILLTGGERYSVVSRRWLTKIFVGGDIVSFALQCIGGSVIAGAKDADKVDLGQNIVLGGLYVQLVFFGIFLIVSAIFHFRISRHPTERSQAIQAPWSRHMFVLYMASGLILVRSIYRVVEYVQGQGSALQTHEFYAYIFDAALMFIVPLVLNFIHPGSIINKEYLKAAEHAGAFRLVTPEGV